jgi:hypothetical protein
MSGVETIAQRKRRENLEHGRAVRSVRAFSGAPLRLRQSKKEPRPVWVLIGHYRRKPSELLGVYREYERGKNALDAAGICGDYHEVMLTRMEVLR